MIFPSPPDVLGGPELKAFEINAQHISGSRFLQIGAYTGAATLWLHSRFPEAEIHDVDTWTGSPLHPEQCSDRKWEEVTSTYFSRVKDIAQIIPHICTSNDFFASGYVDFDFIYIDGDHSTEQVWRDALGAWSHLRLGGIIAFDDYHHIKGDVPRKAVDRFVSGHNVVVISDADLIATQNGEPRQRWVKRAN